MRSEYRIKTYSRAERERKQDRKLAVIIAAAVEAEVVIQHHTSLLSIRDLHRTYQEGGVRSRKTGKIKNSVLVV